MEETVMIECMRRISEEKNNIVTMDVIKSLVSLPATDLNFASELKNATSKQIRIAIGTMERTGGKNKTRIEACKRELRKRDRKHGEINKMD